MAMVAQSEDSGRKTPTVKAIQRAKPSVVNIQGNKQVVDSHATDGSKSQMVNGMGTGVIIDPRGYIVTCYHVVQDVAKIEVTLADGTEKVARLLTYDAAVDLALIKIDSTKTLPTMEVGGSHDLMEGEPVIAIGNPFGYKDTVSIGIISGLHRNVQVNGNQEYKNLIQTNADINPGNSGGPLINIEGEMIGINVAVRMGAQGIGFAIPADDALDVVADLVASTHRHKVSFNLDCRRAWEEDCPYLEVKSGLEPTDEELQLGDRICAIGGRPVKSRLDLELALIEKTPGERVAVEAERNGSRFTVQRALAQGKGVAGVKQNRRATFTNAPSSINSASELNGWRDDIWEQVGVHVVAVESEVFVTNPYNYKGGLKVTEVRRGSQAAQQGIQVGDVLVGIMEWRTATLDNMKWILNNPTYQRAAASKFYVYRNDNFYEGTLSPSRLTR